MNDTPKILFQSTIYELMSSNITAHLLSAYIKTFYDMGMCPSDSRVQQSLEAALQCTSNDNSLL